MNYFESISCPITNDSEIHLGGQEACLSLWVCHRTRIPRHTHWTWWTAHTQVIIDIYRQSWPTSCILKTSFVRLESLIAGKHGVTQDLKEFIEGKMDTQEMDTTISRITEFSVKAGDTYNTLYCWKSQWAATVKRQVWRKSHFCPLQRPVSKFLIANTKKCITLGKKPWCPKYRVDFLLKQERRQGVSIYIPDERHMKKKTWSPARSRSRCQRPEPCGTYNAKHNGMKTFSTKSRCGKDKSQS